MNTRNNNLVLNTPPSTYPIQAALAAIQETLASIQAEVKLHSTAIASLKRREGTIQPRTDELTAQLRSHPEPNNTPYGKLIRIEFPKFSGNDYMKKYLDNTLWEHFKVEVVKRFGVLYDDPIMELKNLKQTGSVQHYQRVFEALLNTVDLPEPIAVSMFIGGLKPEVGTSKRMFQANTLSEAYQLARMQEATNTILKPRYNTPLLPTPKQSTTITTYASKAMTTPTKTNSVGQNSGYVTKNMVHKPYRLTQKELEDKRAKGVTDSPQITLNVLFDLNSYQTMRVRGRVGKQMLCQMESVGIVSAEVEQVLTQFAEVFEIPKDLPPQRSHDHQIPLMPNTPLINVIPYRYPPNQKDAIECMVKELMDSGVIRASQSPFSSPIVMVKKKDGTWRMCIDYRQLNKHTVKDKFPIPVIEELIDELNGSIVFSKLDLRSGYHQIRIEEDDICKTTFRTHEGHYKKFVLVFFDDILIYNKNLKEHCDHLAQVLQVMKDNTLYANRTKCYFAVPQIKVKDSWKNDLDTQNLIKSLENHSYKGNKYSWTGEILKRKGKMKGLKKMVKQMIRNCDVCQRQKPDLSDYPGLIQPLPIPERFLKEISMNFIESCLHPMETSQVAQVFLDQVYKLHGLPESIVSDRDKVFLSNFRKALFAELKVNLKLSTAYHPQIDGQTEVVNRILGCYLRCMCGKNPKEWVKWLPLAEFWYNTNYHTSTKTTPYEVVYCQTPPIYVTYIPGDSRVEEVDRTLQAREEAIKVLKFHLKRSQDRMRNQANKHRTDRQFEVGDWVYLKLQPHRQVSIRQGQQHKFSPKYYGPFKVAERIGEVTYRLELPNSSQIHLVFHISQLKKCHGKDHSVGVLPQLREDGLLDNKPMAILERRLGKVNNKPIMFVLIQWTNKSVEEATWEIYGDLITRFTGFDAVNETVP
nr:hypothetical protein [Tanacetum cinerariifolium]